MPPDSVCPVRAAVLEPPGRVSIAIGLLSFHIIPVIVMFGAVAVFSGLAGLRTGRFRGVGLGFGFGFCAYARNGLRPFFSYLADGYFDNASTDIVSSSPPEE